MADINFKATLIAHEERSYTDKKTGEPRQFSTATIRVGSKLMSIPRAKEVIIGDAMIDKQVDVGIDLSTFGDSLTPSLRIVEVKASK